MVAREDTPGEKQLVAYVVTGGAPEAEPRELREYLQERLPSYMVPTAFVQLAALPVTSNGKLDRRALPAPLRDRDLVGDEYVAPRTSVETVLAGIWAEVLGLERVGVHDNFFELGGDSFSAMQVMAACNHEFGRGLPVTVLFQGSTIETLAMILASSERDEYRHSPVVPICIQCSGTPVFLIHPVGGDILCYRSLARELGADQPVYGVEAPRRTGRAAGPTIPELAASYIQAIRAIREEGPYWLAGWSFGGIVAYEMGRLLSEAGEQMRLVLIDSDAPLYSEPLPISERALREDFVTHLTQVSRINLDIKWDGLWGLEDEQFWGYISSRLEEAGGASLLRGVAFLEQRYQVYCANAEALRRFTPVPYNGSKMILRANLRSEADPALGWGALIRDLRVLEVRGDHYSILELPAVKRVARQCLDYFQCP
ncbi:MAG: alpha/beta fold hydrolase [Zoogloeaceae bacterium]|nr:alpha/beta fold hydrolase [Zoogloeaceae bacterium]